VQGRAKDRSYASADDFAPDGGPWTPIGSCLRDRDMPADNWLRHKMMAGWLPSDRAINVLIVLSLVVALFSLIGRLYVIGPQGLDCQVLRPFLSVLGLIVFRHYVRSMRREEMNS